MASKAQIRKIHVLKKILNMDEDDYHVLVGSFIGGTNVPHVSSKNLSIEEGSALINAMEKIIDRSPELKNRLFASSKQQGYIRFLWSLVSRASDAYGRSLTLDTFLRRRFHSARPDRIPRRVVPKVIKALRAMSENRV